MSHREANRRGFSGSGATSSHARAGRIQPSNGPQSSILSATVIGLLVGRSEHGFVVIGGCGGRPPGPDACTGALLELPLTGSEVLPNRYQELPAVSWQWSKAEAPWRQESLMPGSPPEVLTLLEATDPALRDEAWGRFVDRFSPLLLHSVRSLTREHDRVMDCYAHLLEQLRADDARRLRQYSEDPRSSFDTWLVVVARRVVLDLLRHRYGRLRQDDAGAVSKRAERRRLVDLVTEEIEPGLVPSDSGDAPDTAIRREQLATALLASLATLEPRERLLLTLRFEDDLSAREIAIRLRYPTPFHVYRAINAILASLRDRLDWQGFSDPNP